MKFTVTIDDKVWAKCAERLARTGITGPPHELLEAMLTTSLAGVSPGVSSGDQKITPSTALLLLPGKITAELESERDPRGD